MLPRWLSNLFSKIPAAVLPDTSSNLNKQAHSELVDNILSEKINETPKVSTTVMNLCSVCGKTEVNSDDLMHVETVCSSCKLMPKAKEQPKVSLVAELEKEAGAYAVGDTEENTSAKSHEAQIKQASDYALAEMLTEKHLQGQGVQERWFAEFPKCLAEVKKNRKGCEKEMLEFIPLPAVLDRLNWLNEVMLESHEKEFEATDSKNLYQPLFEIDGKQTWDKAKNAWKEDLLSPKELYENQMPEEGGPGREAADEMEHQAPRSTIASAIPIDDIQMLPRDNFLLSYKKIKGGEEYHKWYDTKEAVECAKKELEEKEFAIDAKIKDFSKEFAVKEVETLQKEAEISSPWVVVKEGDQDVIARITPDEILKKKSEDTVDRKASLIEASLAISAEEIIQFLPKQADDELSQQVHNLPGMPQTDVRFDELPEFKQKLFIKYWPDGINFARKMAYERFGYGKMDSEELGSTVFLAMYKALKYFDPARARPSAFKSFLYKAIHDQLINDRFNFATETERQKYLKRQDRPHVDVAPLETPLGPGRGESSPEDEGALTLSDIVKDISQSLPEEELEILQESNIRQQVAKETVKRVAEELEGSAKQVFDLLAQGYNISQTAKMLGWTHSNVVRYRKIILEKVKAVMTQVAAEVELEHGYTEKLPSTKKEEPELAYSPLPKKDEE
jgi:RNA polymerase sigma factor (sigma-70 family)